MSREIRKCLDPEGLLKAVFIVLALCATPQAHAYMGGPQLLDPLGWDARTSRVYFHNLHVDQTYTFGAVYYFDLAGQHPERRILVGWCRPDANSGDSLQNARLAPCDVGCGRSH